MWVWRHRYAELGAREDVDYVFIFENRGVEVGVTLHHPHGQIYGYPFLPPVPRARARRRRAPRRLRAVRAAARASSRTGGGSSTRTTRVVVYVPYAARWAYEAHVVMREHRASLLECEPAELRALADALQALVRGYDALFERPFPVRDGRPPGADRTGTARAQRAPARRVLPAAAHRREAQVPRRLRAGRRHVHLRHAARGVRRQRCARRSPVPPEHSARVRARARQPDRRAHRLQRRARAAVRDRRGRHRARRRTQPASRARRADRRTRSTSTSATSSRSPTLRPRPAGGRSCAAPSPSSPAPDSRSSAPSCEIGGDAAARRRPVLLGRARGRAVPRAARARRAREPATTSARSTELARLCARVENDWVGAQTGLLDQLASLYGAPETALLHRLPLARASSRCRCGSATGGWWCSTPASATRTPAPATTSAAPECARGMRAAGRRIAARGRARRRSSDLPEPLRRRARHVLGENQRVREAVAALRADDLPALGALLDASHAACAMTTRSPRRPSRRPSQRLHDAGAAGARIVGGGFGGSVLGLFAPDAQPPPRGASRCARAPARTCSPNSVRGS